MISNDTIKKATFDLLRNAVTVLPTDIEEALKTAFEMEEDTIPRMQLKNILDNIELARGGPLPMCQDTGIHIFYVTLGKNMVMRVDDAIIDGLKDATILVPYRFSDNDYMEITVMPKGAGSENMSALIMLNPSQGLGGIKEFTLNTILKAGGKPCPPTIIGMGIGGSADISMKLAKQALLRPVNVRNEDPQIAELENELKEAINTLGIGPMGLGGRTTVLGVNIEYAFCHTASLPVAINLQCWAARRASVRIYPDGKIEHVTHPKEGGE
jgi:fumarate hydratase subunit alpha